MKQRLTGLDNTSVPLPFECVFAIEVENLDTEKLVHDAFADARVRRNREFFEISPERVASALRLTGGNQVSLAASESLDEEALDALKKAKKRRDRFSFKMVDVPIGSELTFSKDDAFACRVVSNNTVDFEGRIMSLSASALEVIQRLGYSWTAVSGTDY